MYYYLKHPYTKMAKNVTVDVSTVTHDMNTVVLLLESQNDGKVKITLQCKNNDCYKGTTCSTINELNLSA